MTRSTSIRCAALLAGFLFAACGKDPEVAKREFLQSGDQYFEQEKFPEAVIQYRNAVQQDGRFGEARKKLSIAYLKVGDAQGAYRESIRAADLLPNDVEAQVNAAQSLLLARQFEDARGRADRAIALDPKNVMAQVIRGNALAGLNQFEDAVAQLEDAIRTAPDNIGTYANLGMLQMMRGERKEAETAFTAAVAADPKSVPARLALANYYWTIGQAPRAETELKATLQLDPKNLLANRALALFYIGSRRGLEAEPYLKTVADSSPGASGKLTLADYYMANRRRDDARKLLESVAASDQPEAAAATLRLAVIDFGGRDLTGARALIDKVLARDPKNVDAHIVLGQLLVQESKLDDALQAVTAAVQAHPESATAQYALGRIHLLRHDGRAAMLAFSESVKLDPRMANAELEMAKLHFAENQLDQAEQLGRAALAKMPGMVEGHLLLSRINLMRGNATQAAGPVRALARIFPESAEIQGQLGQLERLMKNRPAARAAFQRALTANPMQVDALAGLATMDVEDGRADAAKARVVAALARAPKSPPLVLLAAQTHAVAHDSAGAERYARQAIELDPNSIDAYSVLGGLYIAQRRVDEAIVQFSTLVQKQPKPVGAYTVLGMLLQAKNKPEEARDKFQRALELDPRAPVAANNLAWMYAEEGANLDVALGLAQTAKAGLPNRPEVNDTLGWIYYKKGLHQLALPLLLESVAKAPDNQAFQLHLGLTYAALGQTDKARASLEKSIALNASSKHATEAKQALATLKG